MTAKIKDIKAGDKVKVTGFTCIRNGEERMVHYGGKDGPFVFCSEGKHYLSGQIENDQYVGIEKVK